MRMISLICVSFRILFQNLVKIKIMTGVWVPWFIPRLIGIFGINYLNVVTAFVLSDTAKSQMHLVSHCR